MQKNTGTNAEIEKILRKYRILIPLYLNALFFSMFFLEFYLYGNVNDGIITPSFGTLLLVIMLSGFLIGVLSEVMKALQGTDTDKDS